MTQNEVDYLLSLERRDGKWVPETIVAEARNPECPVHGQFEWDDAAAAHIQRIARAKQLINQLPRVQYRLKEGGTIAAPLAIKDPRAGVKDGAYVRTAVLKDDVTAAREAMIQVFGRVTNALTTATGYSVALGLEAEMAVVKTSVADLLRELDSPRREAA